MRVVLFGATGMIGGGVLTECLEDPAVRSVVSVGRAPSGLTVAGADVLERLEPDLTMCFISGAGSGSDRVMWARVKGEAEDALLAPLAPVVQAVAPNSMTRTDVLGRAMIRAASEGYARRILETSDINVLGASSAG